MYNLPNLVYLIANNNQFTGELKSEIGNLSKLSLINLRDNQLQGAVPKEINKLENLREYIDQPLF